ncbi:hypothetical protein V8C40DRAFT_239744 [Trichoderma camerunense]
MRGMIRERETCFVRLVHMALNIGDVDARDKCSTSAATYCALVICTISICATYW